MVPWAHWSLHPKRHVDRFSRFCTSHRRMSHWPPRFPPPKKMSLSFGGSGPPSNTWYLWPTRIIKPNGISISSAVSVLVPNGMLYNALLMGKETPNIAPSHWDCVISPEEDRVTVIGNMRQKCGIDRACGSGDMLAHTYTNTHTHTHTHTHRRAHYNTSPPLLRATRRSN